MAARSLLPRLFRAPIRQSIAITRPAFRLYSDASPVQAPDYLSEAERKIFTMIKEGLQPTKLEVQDISGGCGSMYGIEIVSEKFAGLPVMKQHRLVNQVLGEEIKKWHGMQLKTKAP